jgi:ethanolamine utilization protein EutA
MHDDHDQHDQHDDALRRQDTVVLTSVGIDIGSSGTQVVFSRLLLRRLGEDLTSRFVVVDRETTYRSPVALTPYAGPEHIDAAALGGLIDLAYAQARVDPAEVDTGAVILTGEALRRRNAEAIGTVLADRAGDLVTVGAGHHMEAMLAAHGSGAVRWSHERGCRLLNVDVGGGTTKLSLVANGRVEATAAVLVGGRHVVVDDTGRIVRLDPAGRLHAARAGLRWSLGDRVPPDDLVHVAELMADAVVAAVTTGPDPALALTPPLPHLDGVAGVLVSGGVGEYVHGREERTFGDLGLPLGRALRRRFDEGALPPLLPAGECIRATVVGAAEYTVQLSGSTGFVSDPDALLPRRNLPVVRPGLALAEAVDPDEVAGAVRRHLTAFDPGSDVALALSFTGTPSYSRLLPFARGIRDALAEPISAGRPVYLLLDGDVAMTTGRLLRDELAVGGGVVALDGLVLHDFDHVDLGRLRRPSRTVPVTIKSLVFGDGA